MSISPSNKPNQEIMRFFTLSKQKEQKKQESDSEDDDLINIEQAKNIRINKQQKSDFYYKLTELIDRIQVYQEKFLAKQPKFLQQRTQILQRKETFNNQQSKQFTPSNQIKENLEFVKQATFKFHDKKKQQMSKVLKLHRRKKRPLLNQTITTTINNKARTPISQIIEQFDQSSPQLQSRQNKQQLKQPQQLLNKSYENIKTLNNTQNFSNLLQRGGQHNQTQKQQDAFQKTRRSCNVAQVKTLYSQNLLPDVQNKTNINFNKTKQEFKQMASDNYRKKKRRDIDINKSLEQLKSYFNNSNSDCSSSLQKLDITQQIIKDNLQSCQRMTHYQNRQSNYYQNIEDIYAKSSPLNLMKINEKQQRIKRLLTRLNKTIFEHSFTNKQHQ